MPSQRDEINSWALEIRGQFQRIADNSLRTMSKLLGVAWDLLTCTVPLGRRANLVLNHRSRPMALAAAEIKRRYIRHRSMRLGSRDAL